MSDEILKRLDALAAKLGVAAGHLWEILLKQARVEAMESILFCCLCLGGCYACTRAAKWILGKRDSDGDLGPGAFVIAVALAVVLLVVAIINFYDIWTPLLNPEFFAFQKIAEAIK